MSGRVERYGLNALVFILFSIGCSVGAGEGEIRGSLRILDCNVDISNYSLNPTFFAVDYGDDPDNLPERRVPFCVIRVQRGSYFESFSDGLLLTVHRLHEVAENWIGRAIEIHGSSPSLVSLTFYAQESCEAGYPKEHWRVPVVLRAQSGRIIFRALHIPGRGQSLPEIWVELEDLLFSHPTEAERRMARLSGFFRFRYQRGSPAQLFP
ncbi:MAG: hypothetical protein NZM37_07400 [Sandaracinaceae bacterium]|nr:hypothetical protein [Sandaracinaceae bacterium]MDW8246044.1 hypothetical protein [Sandaracinaceae bacterium]